MKKSKEELKKKVDELEISEDAKITLLEDIEDSVEKEEVQKEETVLKVEYDKVLKELEEIKRKYKERFLSGDAIPERTEDEDLKEEKIIDVKEI